jgi:aminopeptidase
VSVLDSRRVDGDILDRYADLIVSVGANVQPGQVLAIDAEPEARPLVHALARRAYEKGARYVDVAYFDPDVKRLRNELADEATLEWVPPWLGRRIVDLGELDAARISLTPTVPPGLLAGLDPARTGKDRLPTIAEWFDRIEERSIAWTISPFPSTRWAQVVYPGVPVDEAVERLWQDVIHVCRLEDDDPAEAWTRRIEEIWQVASRIDALDLDRLRFTGPGTDLTIGLLPSSRFAKEGGASRTRTGIRHVPNLPTEELFTTPDPERTQGVVAATKPLDIGGALIEGLVVTFEAGSVVDVQAAANAGALRSRIEVDDGAKRLGEVALVDRESRIGKLGRTFFNTLLDENAASHIALGDAYAAPVGDPADLPRINESAVHIDFMIGGDEVDVTGTTKDGRDVPILRGGSWQV